MSHTAPALSPVACDREPHARAHARAGERASIHPPRSPWRPRHITPSPPPPPPPPSLSSSRPTHPPLHAQHAAPPPRRPPPGPQRRPGRRPGRAPPSPPSPTPPPPQKVLGVPDALQETGAAETDAAGAPIAVADQVADFNLRIAFFAKAASFEPAEGRLVLTGCSAQALLIARDGDDENFRAARLENIFGTGKRRENLAPLFANATEAVIEGKPVPFGKRTVLVVKSPDYTPAGGRLEWKASSPAKGPLSLKTNGIAKRSAALSSEDVLITDKEARSPVILSDVVMIMGAYVPHMGAAMALQKAAVSKAPPQLAKTPPATPEGRTFIANTVKAIENSPVTAGRRRLAAKSAPASTVCGVCKLKTAVNTCEDVPKKAPKCRGEVGAPGFWDCGQGQFFSQDDFIGHCVKA